LSSENLIEKNYFQRFIGFIENKNNHSKIFLCLIIFLLLAKIPSLFFTDLQPWDEGMYSTRVLSIHHFGDFFDQSAHSIEGFYSSSHPPLLIWIGYFFTLIFGEHVWVFKIIPFIFSLFCVYFLIKIGEQLFSFKAGLLAALMLSGNIIFSVYAVRFQFDYPYLFFILAAIFLFLKFSENNKKIYILYLGIIFGLCLMTKIIVGVLIPGILFIAYFFIHKNIKVRFIDLVYLSIIGVAIALPWHLYMLLKYGSDFINWFLSFHIFQRAFVGVEHNTKNSGALFHINFLISIIPYSLISFWALIKYLKNFRQINWKMKFLIIWFLLGLLIITIFKTKLEIYSLLFMPQAALLLAIYLSEIKNYSLNEKTFSLVLLALNIFWFLTYNHRDGIKILISNKNNLILLIVTSLVILSAIILVSYFISKKINPSSIYYVLTILFFIGINFQHFIKVPYWADSFHLSEIKNNIDEKQVKNILYIGSNYRANPQFTYYFDGLNIGWTNQNYSYKFVDLKKDGLKNVRQYLDSLEPENQNIIIEKDGINRTDYDSTYFFMPHKFNFVMKSSGYELYR